MDKRLPGLDHLRALAITLVFLCHYAGFFAHPGLMSRFARFGWSGVDLFFVLSGYLIASQLFAGLQDNGKVQLRDFYIRRAFRIIPAYYFVVLLYWLFPAMRHRGGMAPLWKHLSFTMNFGLDLNTEGSFSHAWSLCIEEHFYLLFPIVLILLFRSAAWKRGWVLFPLLLCAGLFLRYWLWEQRVGVTEDAHDFGVAWYRWIYLPSWGRLDGLLAGVALAALRRFRPVAFKRFTRRPALLFAGAMACFAGVIACGSQMSPEASVLGFPLLSVGFGLLVASALVPGTLWHRSWPGTALVAEWSYAIYLLHIATMRLGQHLAGRLGWNTSGLPTFFLCIGITVVAAALLRTCIELPFLGRRRRLLARAGSRAIFTRGEAPLSNRETERS